MCGVERKAITRWPDDKMVQSERGRTKVPGNGIEGGIRYEEEAYMKNIQYNS